ncbi:MAG: hypothetical protein ACD_74C00155G0013 [uncultured bacterium]|nr:MAG: hypothetical protein ACD_74C00155G0013 [uncultured bacterium]
MTLLTIHNFKNQPTISSLRVAELFGRQHGKVLRTIRAVQCDHNFFRQNFREVTYQDGAGRRLPSFKITYAGFNFLIMHFVGKKAREVRAKIIVDPAAFFPQAPTEAPNQISHVS